MKIVNSYDICSSNRKAMKIRLLDAIPLNKLSGIGKNQLKKLEKIGMNTIQDLLLHLPLRYENRTQLYLIRDLLPGIWATIRGKILHTEIRSGRRRVLISKISDGTGLVTLRFFNFKMSMRNRLSPGVQITVYGEIKHGQYGTEIIHPEYSIQNNSNVMELQKTLTPIYHATVGLRQKTLRNLIDQALKLLDKYPVAELLPVELHNNLLSLSDSLRILHHPPSNLNLVDFENGYHPAQRRLILEELLAHNLSMLEVRKSVHRYRALPISQEYQFSKKLLSMLPFQLTISQQRVIEEIAKDLSHNYPMMRLVQGDVGSGKTLVAALAALHVISCGKQVALMAPTELLAEQHISIFRQWFSPLGLQVGYLVGKQKGKMRQAQRNAIASGQVSMIIGTHAMFQGQVQFNCLALVIIDEQHRFGVHQRLALWKKGKEQDFYPHQLIMTATPIPRTLAMAAYTDLDMSVINELPPGRAPINTIAIPNSRRAEIIERIKYACQIKGRQAYWVCTLIKESNFLEAKAALETWKELKLALPDLKIGLIHGRMKLQEKQDVIQAFKRDLLQLLVATTVIEVGIDVPNASLMIIDNPERLGLAQLHQLRGRVGRGSIDSHCVLLYRPPLSKIAWERLRALRNSNDGFIIAQHDLAIRGPGELLGTRQTGNIEFKIADIRRDQQLIPEVQRIAHHMHQNYPKQSRDLIKRWLPISERYNCV